MGYHSEEKSHPNHIVSSMKKLAIPGLLILLIALLAVSWPSIEQRLFERIVHSKTVELFGSPMIYDSLERKGESLSFNRVQFFNTTSSTQQVAHQPGYELKAESATLAYHLDLWSLSCSVELNLRQPTLVGDRGASSVPPEWPVNMNKGKSFFSVELTAVVEEGVVRLLSDEGAVEFGIEGDLSLDKKLSGSIAIRESTSSIETDPSTGTLFLDFDRESDETTVDCAIQSFSAEKLGGCVRWLAGHEAGLWSVENGIVEGRLMTYIDPTGEASWDGELLVSGASVAQEDLAVRGFIDRLKMRLNAGAAKEGASNAPLAMATLEGDSSILVEKEGVALWKAQGIDGTAQFTANGAFEIEVEGVAHAEDGPGRLKLRTEGRDLWSGDPRLHLDLFFASTLRPAVKANLKWKWVDKEKQFLSCSFEHLGRSEMKVAQLFLSGYHPQLNKWVVESGIYSGQLEAFGRPGAPDELRVSGLTANTFSLRLPNRDWRCSGERFELDAMVDIEVGFPLGTKELSLQIKEGFLHAPGMFQGLSEVSRLNADFHVRNGALVRSKAIGDLEGIHFAVEVDEHAPDSIASIFAEGKGEEIALFLPVAHRQKAKVAFGGTKVKLDASLSHIERGVEVEGTAHVADGLSQSKKIPFGFKLFGQAPSVEKTYSGVSEHEVFERDVLALSYLVPNLLQPSRACFVDWAWKQLPWRGIRLEQGWAQAEEIPLEKYVSPFVFSKRSQLTMAGVGDGEVRFDQNQILIEYIGRDLVLESPKLRIVVEEVGQQSQPGLHVFDLSQGFHFGLLPIEKARYDEKVFAFHCEDISGDLAISNEKVFFTEFFGRCEGFELEGRVAIDHSNPKPRVCRHRCLDPTCGRKIQ